MSMGFTTHKHLGLSAGVEDPTQLIIRPEWDAPHVRAFQECLVLGLVCLDKWVRLSALHVIEL